MKQHYTSILGIGFASGLAKVATVTILIMVWILIDKGNAAGQSAEAAKQTVRSVVNSSSVAEPQFRNGNPKDWDEEDVEGEGEGTDFDVYPNPVKDDLVFDFEFTVKSGAPYTVTDALGRLIDQGTFVPGLKKQKLDFSKYRSGMYLVRVQLGGTAVVKRIIKS